MYTLEVSYFYRQAIWITKCSFYPKRFDSFFFLFSSLSISHEGAELESISSFFLSPSEASLLYPLWNISIHAQWEIFLAWFNSKVIVYIIQKFSFLYFVLFVSSWDLHYLFRKYLSQIINKIDQDGVYRHCSTKYACLD